MADETPGLTPNLLTPTGPNGLEAKSEYLTVEARGTHVNNLNEILSNFMTPTEKRIGAAKSAYGGISEETSVIESAERHNYKIHEDAGKLDAEVSDRDTKKEVSDLTLSIVQLSETFSIQVDGLLDFKRDMGSQLDFLDREVIDLKKTIGGGTGIENRIIRILDGSSIEEVVDGLRIFRDELIENINGFNVYSGEAFRLAENAQKQNGPDGELHKQSQDLSEQINGNLSSLGSNANLLSENQTLAEELKERFGSNVMPGVSSFGRLDFQPKQFSEIQKEVEFAIKQLTLFFDQMISDISPNGGTT